MPVENAVIQRALDAITNVQIRNTLQAEVEKQGRILQNGTANCFRFPGSGTLQAYDLKHAVLFAHRYIGFKRAASAPSLRNVVLGWDAGECEEELEAVYNSWKDRRDHLNAAGNAGVTGRAAVGSSFYRYAGQGGRAVATESIKYSQMMATSALIAVKAAGRNVAPTRGNYEWFFGPYTQARWTFVKNNIELLHNVLSSKPVSVYYRGPKAEGIDDSPDPTGSASPSDDVASTWAHTTRRGTFHRYQNDPVCTRFSHVWFGEDAFDRDQRISGAHGSIAGAILHELSHYHCDTNGTAPYNTEHYGATACHNLANNDPAYACRNADSYQMYFERCLGDKNAWTEDWS